MKVTHSILFGLVAVASAMTPARAALAADAARNGSSFRFDQIRALDFRNGPVYLADGGRAHATPPVDFNNGYCTVSLERGGHRLDALAPLKWVFADVAVVATLGVAAASDKLNDLGNAPLIAYDERAKRAVATGFVLYGSDENPEFGLSSPLLGKGFRMIVKCPWEKSMDGVFHHVSYYFKRTRVSFGEYNGNLYGKGPTQ